MHNGHTGTKQNTKRLFKEALTERRVQMLSKVEQWNIVGGGFTLSGIKNKNHDLN